MIKLLLEFPFLTSRRLAVDSSGDVTSSKLFGEQIFWL